jgi:glycosyltransferase involved in cell wall biosynthesis
MLKVLINAYACSPNMGSEPGMGWNWCINLAKYCELHIITEGEFRDQIESAIELIPQGANMHFYYNPVSDEVRQMCWNQGDWRFYKHYKNWQFSTYEMALKIVQTNKIDIVHQLNMIGFREPGFLYKVNNIPLLWGPSDAKEKFPIEYLDGASLKNKLIIRLKNFVTKFQLQNSKRVKLMISRASFVISASSNSQYSFKKYFGIISPLLNETGCYPKNGSFRKKLDKPTFDVLWVGKLDFRKQLSLALQSIAKSNNSHIKLHIVGGGNDSEYKIKADNLGIKDQCFWYGSIKHDEVQALMKNSDVFFFTSVAEGTPHVVLEAIGNGLPILCFNTCGQGDVVNESIGYKIELSNPGKSTSEFSEILNYLDANRELLLEWSQNCKTRQEELSWNNKALKMVELYNSCLIAP